MFTWKEKLKLKTTQYHEHKANPLHGHDRPVFQTWNAGNSEHVPDIRVEIQETNE